MNDFEKIEEIVNEAVIAERNRLLAALLSDEVANCAYAAYEFHEDYGVTCMKAALKAAAKKLEVK
jgi:hypothetical protein